MFNYIVHVRVQLMCMLYTLRYMKLDFNSPLNEFPTRLLDKVFMLRMLNTYE